jgi:hypothetical protein
MTNAAGALQTEPNGIGGWLIFPMLGTVVAPLFALQAIVETVLVFERDLTPELRLFVASEIVFNLCLMAGWIVAAVRLFKHKRSFPSLFVTMLIVSVVGMLADGLVATSIFGIQPEPDYYRSLVRSLISLLIWAPYMAKSKRVRNTFIVS